MMRLALLCALSLGPAALFVGCGGTQERPEVKPGPPIPGLKLSGKWYSQEFGDMQLVHTGKTVTGTYEDPRGPDHNGTVRGEIIGDLVRMEWIKPGNPVAAIMPVRGKGWLRIKKGGGIMEGRWGYDNSDSDGGVWTAEKSIYQ